MNDELYQKLVDLYAGRELSAELEDQMELAAATDASLAHDMRTLRTTVDAVKSVDTPEFTEESYQRILMKLYARGAEFETRAPAPAYYQYNLPLQG